MLTNFSTVYKRLQRLKELDELDFDDVAGSGMTKKELLHLRRERDKLDRSLGGIKDMARTPSALWVVDTKKEHIAVSEARKLGIPVIAILDTNCDPDEVTYPIPGNDDAIRSVSLLTRVVADAVADGLIARAGAANGEDKPVAADASGELGAEEPLAEWERELLEHKASAAQAVASAAAAQEATAGEAPAAGPESAQAEAAVAAPESTAGDAAAPAPEAAAPAPEAAAPAPEAAAPAPEAAAPAPEAAEAAAGDEPTAQAETAAGPESAQPETAAGDEETAPAGDEAAAQAGSEGAGDGQAAAAGDTPEVA
jgi:small subunit ribosomal protein S2